MDLKHRKSKELIERDGKVYPKLGRIAHFLFQSRGHGAS